ncbi:hypothetical protein [Hoeflea alexandrii]
MTGSPTRDELIDRVSYGEMTPDEAEAEAKRLGYELFARVPDPNDFVPSREAQWTLPMAVSWVLQPAIRSAPTLMLYLPQDFGKI